MHGGIKMKTILISIIMFFVFYSIGFAQTLEDRIKILEEALKKQEQTIKEQQKLIEDLKAEMKQVKSPERQEVAQPKETPPPAGQEPQKTSTLDALKEVLLPKEGEPRRDILSYQVGGATLRLIDVSFDGLFAAGASTERDQPLQFLQGGGHDPRKRGFTVQNVELSFSGAVDPYLNAESHIVYFLDPITGESKVELEEAFFTTQKLPYQLQLKGRAVLYGVRENESSTPSSVGLAGSTYHQHAPLRTRWDERPWLQIIMAYPSPLVL